MAALPREEKKKRIKRAKNERRMNDEEVAHMVCNGQRHNAAPPAAPRGPQHGSSPAPDR
jgi:hypothetical protein